MRKVNIDPYYELTLIDEAQDFPKSFLELVFRLTKGEREKKNIIWAYDEMQITSKQSAPWTAELFGLDVGAQAQVDLKRAEARFSGGYTNDIVLRKNFRTQRRVLVTAHALSFGLYNNIIQLPCDEEHWNDLGYQVISDEIKTGHEVKLFSPTQNNAPWINEEKIFEIRIFSEILEEVKWAGLEIKKFIRRGFKPHDILVISLDDKQAKSYFLALSHELMVKGIISNNIISQPYREPPFSVADKVTLSTVYRAKGHEASVVLILGLDAIDNRRRYERNKLYVAMTRSKAWVRVSGIGSKADVLRKEIEVAWQRSPMLEFVVPGSRKFNRIKIGSHKIA